VFARSIPARLNDQRISRQLSSCNLLEILQQCQACRCHDPRDKVFGFLGISDDCKGQLQADYSKSAYEVYKEVAEFLIRTSRDIETSNDLQMRAELSQFAHTILGSPIPPISQSSPGLNGKDISFGTVGCVLGIVLALGTFQPIPQGSETVMGNLEE
jgi:hypothetical protein